MPEKPRPWWKATPAAAPAAAAPRNLADGESREVPGSGAKTYTLRNVAGVYSCTCPSWQHLGVAIEKRSCKHLRAFRGDSLEDARIGTVTPRDRAATPGPAATTGGTVRAEGAAPPLLLAHSWENDTDLTGWWMSEKLDGVRAFWDGTRLVSRLGNTFVAPEWFLQGLPADMPLDGELFGGRGKFQRTVSIVRRQDKGEAWREIQYVVFDAPRADGPFEDRLRQVRERLATANLAHVLPHPHEPCRDTAHLREELARVEGLGGEGLMMRRPGSRYEAGRSHTLLKVKSFKDAEARVVEHLPGAGKHKGRLGALACELADGTKFSVGTGLSDKERTNPPPVGTIITFRYQELSADGVPRFPSYVGVREDVAGPSQLARPAPSATRDARVFVKDGVTWEIRLLGASHVIRRARGEAVETLTTAFSGGALAWRDAEQRITEQRAAGFEEIAPDD